MAAERETNVSEGVFVTVGATRLHYREAGDGAPVVLLHGSGNGDLRDWDGGLFAELATRYRVVAFDRPGIGQSQTLAGGEDPGRQAELLAGAAAKLGLVRPIVVGHSYGGSVALAWALADPDKVAGLVLIGAVAMPLASGPELVFKLLAQPLIGPPLARVLCRLVGRKIAKQAIAQMFAPSEVPPGYMERLGNELLTKPGELYTNAREIAALPRHLPAMAARYPELRVPVHILHGSGDLRLPADSQACALADALTMAELELLDGHGHMLHYHAPERIVAAVARIAAARDEPT